MKNTKLFIALILVLTISPFRLNCQIEYMINGGFEIWDNTASDWYPHSIEYALGWHNLVNTADLKHPNYLGISGTPRSGQACGRFAAPTNGMAEFCYGTTQQLQAGQTYEVSFWIRKDDVTNADRQVGLLISETIPSIELNPFSSSQQPQITLTPTNTQYVKANGCFTAQVSGTHYVTIGPFGGVGTPENIIYLIDDVSVKSIPNGTAMPEAQLVVNQLSFCIGDNIVIDGSLTTNETAYNFEITNLTYNNNQEYNSGSINGQVGTFNISNYLFNPLPGNCYRVTLTAIGVCNDITTIEFCYDNPNVNFLNNDNTVCEGAPTDLTVTGDNGWLYSWSNGQSGIGMKTTSVFPVFPSSQYTVTVTTPSGCSQINTVTLNVHSSNNVAPSLNGINNTGEYVAYTQAGEQVCFDIPSFDNANEVVIMSNNSNLIFGSSFLNNNQPQSTGTFCWTPENNTQGSYYFDVTLADNNACGILSSVFTFQINVVCENCHVCVSFDGDTPTNAQLPTEVNAGNCILAGLDNAVFVGVNNSVYFQAGNYIELGPAFDTQDGLFEAVIDPVTCLTGCANCCDNFDGFTIDFPFPNVFSPNGDGVNDVFYFKDDDNPTCAFNATRFEFFVVDRLQRTVYYLESEGNNYRPDLCCPFIAPTNGTPSSIYWDGRINTGLGSGTMVGQDWYTWGLTLYNCENSEFFHDFMWVADPSGIVQSNEEENQINRTDVSNNIESQVNLTDSLNNELIIYPNPSSNKLYIKSTRDIEQVQFYDNNGKLIFSKMNFFNQPINISNLADGMYFIKIINKDKNIMTKSFLKQ